jgi:hypothetical protein
MQNAHGRFHFRPFPSLDTTSTSDIWVLTTVATFNLIL